LNSLGQIIQTPVNQHFHQGVFTLDVKNLNLSAGAYLIKMTTDSGVSMSNFIVK
jgi:hypothetical protein